MTGVRERIEAFIDWSSNYFSKFLPIQVLDRSHEDASNGMKALKAEIVAPRRCTADLHGMIFDYLGV
jgi:hypothetical protein